MLQEDLARSLPTRFLARRRPVEGGAVQQELQGRFADFPGIRPRGEWHEGAGPMGAIGKGSRRGRGDDATGV
jgi:hypothetical protein